MKRLLIIALFILGAAITTAQDGSLVIMLAQAGSEAPAPPAAVETKPAPAATEAPGAPAAAETKAAPAKTPGTPQKQDHKEYAEMEVKECTSCHKGSGISPNHDADWLRGHRLLAVKPQKNCKDCHNQSFCLDCHTGGGINANLETENPTVNTAPSSHRTDWREIHPIKAHDNPQTCTRCHRSQFCSDCHARFRGEDLMVLSHRKGWSNLQAGSPGPAHSTFTADQCQSCHLNGLLPKHVWSSDHAREARRNLQACQSCHSDGQVCMTCHSARTGLRVNPHPRNWDKVKNSYKNKSSGRSCIVCHDNY